MRLVLAALILALVHGAVWPGGAPAFAKATAGKQGSPPVTQGGMQGSPPILQDRPQQADGVVRLLLDLEAAIGSGRVEDFRAIATPTVSAPAIKRFESAARGGAGTRAIVRERTRRANGQAYDVIVDVLVTRQSLGRIATWQLLAAPGLSPGQYLIDDLRELAAVDGLLRLQVDVTRQFAVKDLVINAPDLSFKMASGSAFVAESPNGITALVLRGKAEISFTPPDPAEQGQVRIFSGRPALTSQVDSAFLRINPAEFVLRVSQESLTPTRVDPVELQRALQTLRRHGFEDVQRRCSQPDDGALVPRADVRQPRSRVPDKQIRLADVRAFAL